VGQKSGLPPAFASLAGLSRKLRCDDNSYDNRDDNHAAYNGILSPKCLMTCLVTVPARRWQCGVTGSSPVSSTFGHLGVLTRTREVNESLAVARIQTQLESVRMR
jgi:hypothetical protein